MSASVGNRNLTNWLLSLVTILTELSMLHYTEFFSLNPNNNFHFYLHICYLVFNIITLAIFSTVESRRNRYLSITIRHYTARNVRRDSSVGIATCYGLDGPGIESRWGGEIFRTCPDRPWGPPSLLYNEYRVFPGGKATGAWG